MPPLPSQKGTGKKNRDPRQSRSRNTTPSLGSTGSGPAPSVEPKILKYLDLPRKQFRISEEFTESYGHAIPSSKELDLLIERLESLQEAVELRGPVVDKGMRLLAQAKKDRQEEVENTRRDEERKERQRKDAADEEERGRNKASKMKKRKEQSLAREERPLTHGAHGLAPQDGSNLDRISPSRESKVPRRMSRDNDSASSSLSPAAPITPTATGMDLAPEKAVPGGDDDDSSSDEHQPPHAPAVPHHQTFGEDPTTFPDPTVYEIRQDVSHLPRDKQMEIYSVSYFPEDNLEDLIPGSPPDMDFSNAKPTNQVQSNTFQTYLDGFFRNITEEDLAFLRDRGDRVQPFLIPRRGKEHYTERWSREDNNQPVDSPHQSQDKFLLNQPRGSIDDINDTTAETDQFSAGPILNRLLSLMRPEHRAPPAEEKPSINGVSNGEASTNGEVSAMFSELDQILNDVPPPLPPATFMPESNSEAWKKATHPKLDYAQVDERIKQELRYIGFLGPDVEPEYDEHLDDEVTARLRYLQEQLKERMIKNGAMKSRLMDIAKSAMASQEYNTICEDLDTQVQTAYLKRTRTLGKSKKAKRPGGAGGGSHFVGGAAAGMARPGIGDVTRTLMDRRQKWKDTVGPVLDPEVSKIRRNKDPNSSIFKPEDMEAYTRRERESWDEEVEED